MEFLWHMESDFLFSDWDYLTIDIYGLSATNQPDALGEKARSYNKTNLTNIAQTERFIFKKKLFLVQILEKISENLRRTR